jgi:polyphosphate kinase
VLGLIARETQHAREGRDARIVAKMNSLVDADVIAALYAASQAGVQIDLLVRGICCLRPAVPEVSERIRVHAIVDRFLEHSRIFHFKNGGSDEVYCSSADWMPRNFRRRVEVMYPILDETLKRRLTDEILGTMRRDSVKAWSLRSDGSYARVLPKDNDEPVRSQQRFMELARERSRENEGILGLSSKSIPGPVRALDKLRRRGKKKKRRNRTD